MQDYDTSHPQWEFLQMIRSVSTHTHLHGYNMMDLCIHIYSKQHNNTTQQCIPYTVYTCSDGVL